MDARRLQYEKVLMEKYFPRKHQFVNMDDPKNSFLDFAHRTESTGSTYNLKIIIPEDYPNSLPAVYVMYPKPDDFVNFQGQPMYTLGASHGMHTLRPSGKFVQLCHFLPRDWHANCSLYLVAMKCACWLEVFQEHLQTGKPVDDYVSS